MPKRLLIPFVCFLASGACATAPRSQSLPLPELSTWQAPAPQRCSVEQPRVHVQPEEFLDLTKLSAATADVPPGTSIFSIGTDSTGALSRLRLIESSLPQEQQPGVLSALRSSLSPSALPERWAARVQVETVEGAPARVALGAYQSCPPVLQDRQGLGPLLQQLLAEIPPRSRSDVAVEAYVNTAGLVEDVRIRNSTVGLQAERELQRIARQLRYLPARLDREPVAIWTRLPIRFRRER